MTIEELFVNEYEKLKNDNALLRAKLDFVQEAVVSDSASVRIVREDFELIKVSDVGKYELTNRFFKGSSSDDLIALKSEIERSETAAIRARGLISVMRKTFPLEIAVRLKTNEKHFILDDELNLIDLLGHCRIDAWRPPSEESKLLEIGKDSLLGTIRCAINCAKRKEEESE